jgi:hypothetical protein
MQDAINPFRKNRLKKTVAALSLLAALTFGPAPRASAFVGIPTADLGSISVLIGQLSQQIQQTGILAWIQALQEQIVSIQNDISQATGTVNSILNWQQTLTGQINQYVSGLENGLYGLFDNTIGNATSGLASVLGTVNRAFSTIGEAEAMASSVASTFSADVNSIENAVNKFSNLPTALNLSGFWTGTNMKVQSTVLNDLPQQIKANQAIIQKGGNANNLGALQATHNQLTYLGNEIQAQGVAAAATNAQTNNARILYLQEREQNAANRAASDAMNDVLANGNF